MKVTREVGLWRILRYSGWSAFATLVRAVPTPVLRAILLRAGGAHIGRQSLVQAGLRLENLDRHRGLAALTMGHDCWIGYDVHLDLAADIIFGDQVTLAARVSVNTHLSVGYGDHPLHQRMAKRAAPVVIGSGSFVGTGAVLLAGTRLGPETFVAAGAVVSGEHPDGVLLGGVPARVIRQWE